MFDLLSENRISKRGFVAGIQHAPLGNSLSTMASMYELAHRMQITTAYTDLLRTSARDLCRLAKTPSFSLNGDFRDIDISALTKMISDLGSWVGASGAISDISGAIRPPSRLAELLKLRDKIIVITIPQKFDSLAKVQLTLKELCARNNGIFLIGAYWLQYLADDGPATPGLANKLQLSKNAYTIGTRVILDQDYNVGVHLRLGEDYTHWHGGIYHFEIEAYISVMKMMNRAKPHSVFHIFSDKNIPRSTFPAELDIRCQPGATVDNDFVNLSRCDVAVGPPSTFCTWASFLGKRNRIVLTRDRIEMIAAGQDPFSLVSEVSRPTFSYVPDMQGPL